MIGIQRGHRSQLHADVPHQYLAPSVEEMMLMEAYTIASPPPNARGRYAGSLVHSQVERG